MNSVPSNLEYITCTPPDQREAANNLKFSFLPEKSRKLYMDQYNKFKNWCFSKKVVNITENVLLVYFEQLCSLQKVSTLWAKYSMLKATLIIEENVDLSKYSKLISFLKQKNRGYKPKKSKVLSKNDIDNFLIQASDEDFLSTKTILVIGVAGACRSDELLKMVVTDLDIRAEMIVINIPNSKNGNGRKFVVVDQLWIAIIKKYLQSRPIGIQKLFIRYSKGRHYKQNIGHNTIGKVPNVVAKFLKLKDANQYTGHSLRRSSATLLAENGGDLLSLKRHGGWKSSTVAEGYIEESVADKKRIANIVQNQSKDNLSLISLQEQEHQSHLNKKASTSFDCPNVANINLPGNVVSNGSASSITYNNCSINYNFK